MSIFEFFRRRPDGRAEPIDSLTNAASLMGRHGNAVRRDRERARIIAKTNEMRAQMGMEPI